MLMSYEQLALGKLERGRVLAIDHKGDLLVELSCEDREVITCDVLQATDAATPKFNPGDSVLVHCGNAGARGCVLGKIVRYEPKPREPEPGQSELPGCLVVEAGQMLTLRCGEGTIVITQDGRILIKGRDLVSRAKQTNRIKGGSVQIN